MPTQTNHENNENRPVQTNDNNSYPEDHSELPPEHVRIPPLTNSPLPIVRHVIHPTEFESRPTGTRPRTHQASLQPPKQEETNKNSDRNAAITSLQTSNDTDGGHAGTLPPMAPYSSYFEDVDLTEDTSLPYFDRTLFDGIKDSPPIIRRAKKLWSQAKERMRKE